MKQLLSFLVLFFILGCSTKYMIKMDSCAGVRDIKPPPGKAALVVARTDFMANQANIEVYLDRKFIGTTKGKSIFAAVVDPGEHFITTVFLRHTLYFRFDPNKTYYVLNNTMGFKLELVDAQSFLDQTRDISCYSKDSTEVVPDLSEDDWKTARSCKNRVGNCTR